MKYWEMLNVNKKVTGGTWVPPQTTEIINPFSSSDNIEAVKDAMKDIDQNENNKIPKELENTNLTDDEVNKILNCLLEYQKRYFSDIPLPDQLDKKFLWNIPREVYNAFQDWDAYDYPDGLNPIYWFYVFCLEDPMFVLGKFLITAINSISDDDYAVISQSSDDYDQTLLDVENDDDNEIDG